MLPVLYPASFIINLNGIVTTNYLITRTRDSVVRLRKCLKKSRRRFSPISSYLVSIPVANYQDIPRLSHGEGHGGNTFRGAVPEGERIIAVHTDGVIIISIPIIVLRECPVIPHQKTTSAVLSTVVIGDYVPYRDTLNPSLKKGWKLVVLNKFTCNG